MPTITNEGTNTLSSSLKNTLPNCDRIDALVGYFYFSGFKDLHNELKDKKIRILVGMDIDNKILEKVSTLKELNFDHHIVETNISSRSGAKEDYIENFSKIFNDTDYFDNEESQKAFEIFLDKIKDGSLEIKKTAEANHSKFYILHEKTEQRGIVIVGSSNLTISGLKEQREHNIVLSEKHYYESHIKDFENCWNDPSNIVITDIESSENFIKEVKRKIWLYSLPEPSLMYYRVLSEYFAITEIENMKTPKNITGGKFSDLKYQKDAINLGIDRIKKFGGVIIADVVGLGKSVVASAIAHNLGIKTIIIAPPHLESQWKDYMAEFDFKGFVYTTGKIEEAFERHGNDEGRLLIILDEAHKHRNEDTDNYKVLHKLCAGHYVMALSATPFNNDPKDIYALIKLFSTPGQSTIRTVENLSMSFHMLFKRYKAVRKELRKTDNKGGDQNSDIKIELHAIADELRRMIEPLIIRRSRLDLEEIEEYRNDLKVQGVAFAKVKDPELLEYDLGDMFEMYIDTLEKISPEDKSTNFIGARYKPASYIKQGSEFIYKLVENDDDDEGISAEEKIQQIKQAQVNIAKFMRRLLVRRFESSIGAFNISLGNMITSTEVMLDWYVNRKEVPIYKKGALPDVEYLNDMNDQEREELLAKFEDKGLIRIPVSELQPEFEQHLKDDIRLLKEIQVKWAGNKNDPKFDFLRNRLSDSIARDRKRKIIIFTEFSDTANYIYQKLSDDGFKRVFKYSSEDASDENKRIIRTNFDAGLDDLKQADDFDVIIATDAISEGFNLHRAGTVINYDIPYNPTRVIQRVGRINRINKKVFEELYIYNFFPTLTGELETRTKAISTLKMDLIHTLLGEDTKTLTSEEDLKNYFAKQYKEENSKNESLSWDAPYRNTWLKIKDDQEIMRKISGIPHRSRIARKAKISGVVAFAKKSGNFVFAFGENPENVQIVSPQFALPLFDDIADSEKALQTSINFEPIYKITKEHIFKDNTKAPVDSGRKQDSLNKIKILADSYPQAKDLCIDVIRVIKDLDGLPNGVLKEIAELKIDKNDFDKAFQELRELVPHKYLENIFKTAERANDSGKLIVLSEELIA
ncbi:MAG: Helicase domain protein [Candidatus Moranbacteria bacterium GW2011_GWF2_36_839]|nr:MAG: Helicase domain protein [Candidatus Moranbacteria bacterium GW2011_GWF1_36_78]KKQ17155.1 MAG: Helicase domain protein [Candidatus Moranbacteria bacterium GW2011_GWF2_36_839]HAT74147.1 helicase [Candidatus Moranbacteria bacterium]HBY10645.1 helicase [Candidatus Moranbacteria bacterium]